MQEYRKAPISPTWANSFSTLDWHLTEINPEILISPYKEFRQLVEYPCRGMNNKEILKKIIESNNELAKKLISEPLVNNPPIIIWKIANKYLLEDGCKRSLIAINSGMTKITAYLGIPNKNTSKELLDYGISRTTQKP